MHRLIISARGGLGSLLAVAALCLAPGLASGAVVTVLDSITGGSFFDITTDGTTLFVSGSDGIPNNGDGVAYNDAEIFTLPISGGTLSTLAQGWNPAGITLGGPDLFYVDPNANPTPSGGTLVFKFAKSGPPTVVGPHPNIGSAGHFDGLGLHFDAATNRLYSTDSNGIIRKFDTNGGNVVQLGDMFGSPNRVAHVTVGGGTVYTFDTGPASGNATVFSVPVAGGVLTPLLSGGPFVSGLSTGGIAFGNGTIFMSNADSIYSMPAGGGAASLVATIPGVRLSGLAYFDNSLYVVDNNGSVGNVYRVTLAAVPEPGTLLLLALGVSLLAAGSRKGRYRS